MNYKELQKIAKEVGAVINVLMLGRHDNTVFTTGELERFAEALIAELAKQNEPKKVKLEAWLDEDGLLMHKANFGEGYVARGSWIRIPELDREITLPEGETR